MDREKLFKRIRKLYAMSRENESSPHEAEIAMRRCQSLSDTASQASTLQSRFCPYCRNQ